jgi:hypothetical protein
MSDDLLTRTVQGAIAAVLATFALQGLRTASQKYAPGTMAPVRQDPGEFMVEQATEALPAAVEQRIPESVESAAAQSLHLAYPATAGALYAALRPHGDVLLDGAALGLGVWAAGYLGWLPATGLMPPVTEQNPAQTVGPAVRHALFGIGTVLAYQQLQEWF